jgi:hypothetical protein
MRRIFNYKQFLNEALRDEIPKHQINAMHNMINYKPDTEDECDYIDSDLVLNSDVPKKTENIIEGVWKLNEEDKNTAIKAIFGLETDELINILDRFEPSERFIKILKESCGMDLNIKKPSIKDIRFIYSQNFRLLNINETKSNSKILRDENGKPVKDENDKFIYVEKEVGEPIFSNNKSNFNEFFNNYQEIYNEKMMNPYHFKEFMDVYSVIIDINRKFDFEIFDNFDLELYISSKSEDILNMAISAFYNTCQSLYDGSFRNMLPINIFDKNSKISYLRFNTPFVDNRGNTIPFTPFSRCIIRDIKGELYFDTVYPKLPTMKKFHHSLITKYTGMENTYKGSSYYYKPKHSLPGPYMDTLVDLIPVFDATEDEKAIILAKEFNLDLDYISIANSFTYNFYDESYYVFDTEKDHTIIIEVMLSKLKQNFTFKYPVDEWSHYIDIDKMIKEHKAFMKEVSAKYKIDLEDIEADEVLKYLKSIGKSNFSINAMFKYYINYKFYDKILLDWKTQIFKVLGGNGREVVLGKYIIIQKM